MGGRAFLQTFPARSFPRLQPRLYDAVKHRLHPCMKALYECAQVPAEAPEKKDHGDLDFVVAMPLNVGSPATTDDVKNALGAIAVIPLEGSRTSNYAVPLNEEEIKLYTDLAAQCRADGDDEEDNEGPICVQVDVTVCDSREQVENIMMFHGYGDIGEILISMAHSYGLALSTKGLKISIPPPACDPPMHLTSSPTVIFEFLGLSVITWTKGFETQLAVFEFIATSRLFNPAKLVELHRNSHKKIMEARTMYRNFILWARDQSPRPNALSENDDVVTEALVTFGKKKEWDVLARRRYEKAWIKENFNGKVVGAWTGLGWRGVKALMDEVRKNAGGELMLVGKPIDDLRTLTLETRDSMGLQ